MTTPNHDDDAMRDPRFDAAWRGVSREEPPPSLDAAIRAAARREVGAGPQREVTSVPEATRPERWWWPLAAAATIGAIAIGVLQLVAQDRDTADSTQAIISDMPAGSVAETAQSAPRAAPTPTVSPEPAVAAGAAPPPSPTAPRASERPTRDVAAPRASPAPAAAKAVPPTAATPLRAPRPFPAETGGPDAGTATPPTPSVAPPGTGDAASRDAPAAPQVLTQQDPAAIQPQRAGVVPGSPTQPQRAAPLHEDRATSTAAPVSSGAIRAREDAARAARSVAITPRAEIGRAPVAGSASTERHADAAVTAKAGERASLSVGEWIALIRELVADGRRDDVTLELKAFRFAHPDAEALLPPDLRAWRSDTR